MASHDSVIRRQIAWPATGLANSAAMTIHPFWLRTSVMARSNVRSARSMSGKAESALRDRISSCGVEAAAVALQQRVVVTGPEQLGHHGQGGRLHVGRDRLAVAAAEG